MFAFCAKTREKAKINENIETLNFSGLYGKMKFPPQIQLFFQNTYSGTFFCIFKFGWTNLFAFCTRKRQKSNINEHSEKILKNRRLLMKTFFMIENIQFFRQV